MPASGTPSPNYVCSHHHSSRRTGPTFLCCLILTICAVTGCGLGPGLKSDIIRGVERDAFEATFSTFSAELDSLNGKAASQRSGALDRDSHSLCTAYQNLYERTSAAADSLIAKRYLREHAQQMIGLSARTFFNVPATLSQDWERALEDTRETCRACLELAEQGDHTAARETLCRLLGPLAALRTETSGWDLDAPTRRMGTQLQYAWPLLPGQGFDGPDPDAEVRLLIDDIDFARDRLRSAQASLDSLVATTSRNLDRIQDRRLVDSHNRISARIREGHQFDELRDYRAAMEQFRGALEQLESLLASSAAPPDTGLVRGQAPCAHSTPWTPDPEVVGELEDLRQLAQRNLRASEHNWGLLRYERWVGELGPENPDAALRRDINQVLALPGVQGELRRRLERLRDRR